MPPSTLVRKIYILYHYRSNINVSLFMSFENIKGRAIKIKLVNIISNILNSMSLEWGGGYAKDVLYSYLYMHMLFVTYKKVLKARLCFTDQVLWMIVWNIVRMHYWVITPLAVSKSFASTHCQGRFALQFISFIYTYTCTYTIYTYIHTNACKYIYI